MRWIRQNWLQMKKVFMAQLRKMERQMLLYWQRIGVTGTENYKYAFKVLTLVNKEKRRG